MGAALVVKQDSKQIAKAFIEKKVFVVGRSKRCNLTLEDTNISREHCVITSEHGVYQVSDRGSRNGTKVNGAAIGEPTVLKDGDRIVIGPFELTFYAGESDGAAGGGAGVDDEGETRYLSPAELRGKKAPGKKAREAGKGGIVVKVTSTAGPLSGNVYQDWEGALTIGRGMENAVVIPDDSASTSHARIIQEDGGYYIEDLGSSNGTFVQGVRVQRKRLRNGNTIRVGSATFVFSAVDPAKRRRTILVGGIAVLALIMLAALVKVLQPEDMTGAYVERGYDRLRQQDFVGAKNLFEEALRLTPDDPRASKGLQTVKAQAEVTALLTKAQSAAANERYGEALDICYRVLRLHPKNKDAVQLESILKSVEEARLAIDARNWVEGIRLLNRTVESYPNSPVLQRLLAQANSEQKAMQDLDDAQDFVKHEQPEAASPLLRGIAPASVYYAAAQQILKEIHSVETLSEAAKKARIAYRNGNTVLALAEVNRGLEVKPEDEDLQQLKKRVNKMLPLVEETRGAEGLLTSNDVDAIRKMMAACEAVVSAEPDQLNNIRSRADRLQRELNRRLVDLSRQSLRAGDSKLDQGDKSGALEAYRRAAAADPSNKEAASRARELEQNVTGEAQKYYREGIVLEEQGQRVQALRSFKKVLEVSFPGERYYDMSKKKVLRLEK